MAARRVFVVGESLFAEALRGMLANSGLLAIAGVAPTADVARPLIEQDPPDVVILVGADAPSSAALGLFLTICPTVAVICTDLNTHTIHLFTGHAIGARFADLLDAIATLPTRG